VSSFEAPPLVFIALVRQFVASQTSASMQNRLWEKFRSCHVQAGGKAAPVRPNHSNYLWQAGWQVSPLVHGRCPGQFYVSFHALVGPLVHRRLRWRKLIRRCFARCHQGCVSPLFLLKSLHSTIFQRTCGNDIILNKYACKKC
jgi:hypothetical protein